MSYHCPMCGQKLEGRWPNITGIAGGLGLGLFILLFPLFFRQYNCPEHGRIDSASLTPTERGCIIALSILWLGVSLVGLFGLGWFILTLFES